MPDKVIVEEGLTDFMKDLTLENFDVFPEWDPWVKPSDAPHMGHYKWYQFYKYIWDAIKIA
jgi:hypothetical protein